MDRQEITEIVNAAISTRLERQNKRMEDKLSEWQGSLITEVERVVTEHVQAAKPDADGNVANGEGQATGRESELQAELDALRGEQTQASLVKQFHAEASKHGMSVPDQFVSGLIGELKELDGKTYAGTSPLQDAVAKAAMSEDGKRFIRAAAGGGTGMRPSLGVNAGATKQGLKGQLVQAVMQQRAEGG